ncbi:MAG TPA: hypothetical protein VMU33_05120 [Burkholderiaceae bacterium]|nr:hypothetical protein [Burkholderiaceae bacterium]
MDAESPAAGAWAAAAARVDRAAGTSAADTTLFVLDKIDEGYQLF